MRTTLSVPDDVLAAVRKMAIEQKRTIGDVVSDLLRLSLASQSKTPKRRNGIALLVVESRGVVDLQIVNDLRDEHA